jgi:hypothetical protein
LFSDKNKNKNLFNPHFNQSLKKASGRLRPNFFWLLRTTDPIQHWLMLLSDACFLLQNNYLAQRKKSWRKKKMRNARFWI